MFRDFFDRSFAKYLCGASQDDGIITFTFNLKSSIHQRGDTIVSLASDRWHYSKILTFLKILPNLVGQLLQSVFSYFSFVAENGIKVEEKGELKNKGDKDKEAQSAVGKDNIL